VFPSATGSHSRQPRTAYRIFFSGVPVDEALVYPERELAINSSRVFGMRNHAQAAGYRVVAASIVIATYLSHVMQVHAHELLGREEVQNLPNALAKTAPKLVEDLISRQISLAPWYAYCKLFRQREF
jgi:flagellar biosynthesis protein FlhA